MLIGDSWWSLLVIGGSLWFLIVLGSCEWFFAVIGGSWSCWLFLIVLVIIFGHL